MGESQADHPHHLHIEGNDAINPQHYKGTKFEAIEVLSEFFPDQPVLWQVAKYLLRLGKKNPTAEDAQKAMWYFLYWFEQQGADLPTLEIGNYPEHYSQDGSPEKYRVERYNGFDVRALLVCHNKRHDQLGHYIHPECKQPQTISLSDIVMCNTEEHFPAKHLRVGSCTMPVTTDGG